MGGSRDWRNRGEQINLCFINLLNQVMMVEIGAIGTHTDKEVIITATVIKWAEDLVVTGLLDGIRAKGIGVASLGVGKVLGAKVVGLTRTKTNGNMAVAAKLMEATPIGITTDSIHRIGGLK